MARSFEYDGPSTMPGSSASRGTNGVIIDKSDTRVRHNANSGYFSLPDAQRFAGLKAGDFHR